MKKKVVIDEDPLSALQGPAPSNTQPLRRNNSTIFTFLAKAEYPPSESSFTILGAASIRELLDEAFSALAITEASSWEQYSAYCVTFGQDVVELAGEALDATVLSLSLKDNSTIFLSAPEGIRPQRTRKKRVKLEKEVEVLDRDRYKGFNAVNVYKQLYSSSKSKQLLAFEFFDICAKDLLIKTGFSTLSEEVVEKLLARDTLSGKEVDIFIALVDWGRRRLTSSDIEGGGLKKTVEGDEKKEEEKKVPATIKADPTKLAKILQPFLGYVRFPLMTGAEIAASVDPVGLLTKQQVLDLFTWMALEKAGTKNNKLPASIRGFSTKPRSARKPPGWFRFDATKKHATLSLSPDGMSVFSTSSNVHQPIFGDIVLEKGVWEWEIYLESLYPHAASCNVGVAQASFNNYGGSLMIGYSGHVPGWAFAAGAGQKYNSNSAMYGLVCKPGDTIGVKLDMDKKTIEFFLNGKSQGIAFDNINVPVRPALSLYGPTRCVLRF